MALALVPPPLRFRLEVPLKRIGGALLDPVSMALRQPLDEVLAPFLDGKAANDKEQRNRTWPLRLGQADELVLDLHRLGVVRFAADGPQRLRVKMPYKLFMSLRDHLRSGMVTAATSADRTFSILILNLTNATEPVVLPVGTTTISFKPPV